MILNNKNPEIKFERVPDSYSSTYALMYLNRYLNLANLYNINNISEEKLIGYIEKDLKEESEVVFIQKQKTIIRQIIYIIFLIIQLWL